MHAELHHQSTKLSCMHALVLLQLLQVQAANAARVVQQTVGLPCLVAG